MDNLTLECLAEFPNYEMNAVDNRSDVEELLRYDRALKIQTISGNIHVNYVN